MICDCTECAFMRMARQLSEECTCGHTVFTAHCNVEGRIIYVPAEDTPDGKRGKMADLKPRKQKPQVQMLPYDPHAWEARVVEHGAKKYARGNFRLPIEGEAPHEKASEYIRAAMGHLWAQAEQIERYITGLDKDVLAIDNDSGLPHLAHAMCSVSFAIQAGIDGGIFPKDCKKP